MALAVVAIIIIAVAEETVKRMSKPLPVRAKSVGKLTSLLPLNMVNDSGQLPPAKFLSTYRESH